ncbi:hypothetical protein [Pluralibacter gergoviae]
MARPKKTVEVPGQEPAPPATAGADAGTGIDSQQQTIVVGEQPSREALLLTARNELLATLNEQGAAIIARFEALGFTDLADQQLTDNLDFLQLVKKATTTAAPAAPHGYVTNEEGKKQPAAGKPVLTQHGWHVPG